MASRIGSRPPRAILKWPRAHRVSLSAVERLAPASPTRCSALPAKSVTSSSIWLGSMSSPGWPIASAKATL
eukprot:9324376-Alexandrium_andersonii.AAC.1